MEQKRLVYFVTEDWYFCLHWLNIAMASKDAGYDVTVVTRVRDHGDFIRQAGMTVIPFEISRQGMNPFKEFSTIVHLIALFKELTPDIVHNVAIKPLLYGWLASRIARVKHTVNTLAGLGWLFTSRSIIARILNKLVASLLRRFFVDIVIIAQNHDDALFLRSLGLRRVKIIRGAGVDISTYVPSHEPSGPLLVILPARMLWDKGVKDFVDAVYLLAKRGITPRCVLVGGIDKGNPAAIPEAQLRRWTSEGVVEWWGQSNNMPGIYKQAHIVCLPSYREGLPTVLSEAAASGRPIVTTDTVGCRDVVRHGENGFLVSVNSPAEIANAIQQLAENPELRKRMGRCGRKIAEREFAVARVVAETLAVYGELLNS